jgi:cytochrome P450
MWAAANRPSPLAPGLDESDVSKGKGPHFAFGRGIHFCIGAHLARLEARIVIERLLAQTTSFSLDPGSPPIRRTSVFLRRHTSLLIVLQAA